MDSLPGEIWVNFAIAGAFSYATNWVAVFVEFICDKISRPLWTGRLQMHLYCSGITTLLLSAVVILEYTGWLLVRKVMHSLNPKWQKTNVAMRLIQASLKVRDLRT